MNTNLFGFEFVLAVYVPLAIISRRNKLFHLNIAIASFAIAIISLKDRNWAFSLMNLILAFVWFPFSYVKDEILSYLNQLDIRILKITNEKKISRTFIGKRETVVKKMILQTKKDLKGETFTITGRTLVEKLFETKPATREELPYLFNKIMDDAYCLLCLDHFFCNMFIE